MEAQEVTRRCSSRAGSLHSGQVREGPPSSFMDPDRDRDRQWDIRSRWQRSRKAIFVPQAP
jgi:hypothetical protein